MPHCLGSLYLPLVSREWRNGSNSSYNCTPFFHSLLTKGRCRGLCFPKLNSPRRSWVVFLGYGFRNICCARIPRGAELTPNPRRPNKSYRALRTKTKCGHPLGGEDQLRSIHIRAEGHTRLKAKKGVGVQVSPSHFRVQG